MRISLNQLETFSVCPLRAKFALTQSVSQNLELDIVNSVMKKAYLRITETGHRADWRRIVSWVDKLAFKNIDVLDPDSYKFGKNTSEHCLIFLRTWYEALYLKEDVVSYVDVNLETEINNHIVYTTVPIIKTDGDRIQILQVTDITRDNKELYNSLEMRGMAMLLSKHLTEEYIDIVSIALGTRGGFNVAETKTKIDDHVRLRNKLAVITAVYGRVINNPYPSIGSNCQTCPFKWRCSL